MRRYQIAWLTAEGRIEEATRLAPALPPFEAAFAAFARGTLFTTETGPVAVEDLLPGDKIRTVEAGFRPLLWKGGTTIVPNAPGQSPGMATLIRIAADAFGIARPMPDLLLGPMAQIYHRGEAVQRHTGADGAFLPAADLADGCNVVRVSPPSAVQVFHLGLGGQLRIAANGVEVETQHPGPRHGLGLRSDLAETYLSLFPHVTGFDGFGPARYPRLPGGDLQVLGVA